MAESMIFADNAAPPTEINNDATERTFWTKIINANTLLVADALRVGVWADYRNDVGSQQQMTFRFYFGAAISVVVRDQQTAAVGPRDAFWLWIVTMRGATNLQYVIDEWADGSANKWAATPPATDVVNANMDFAFGGNNLGIDTTAAVTMKMTGQLQTANTLLGMTYYAARIEQITLDPAAGPFTPGAGSLPMLQPTIKYIGGFI